MSRFLCPIFTRRMLCTKAKALSWSIYLGLFVVLATIPLTWVLWAKKVKFEHDIGQMITEVGRGNQSGLFLLGSLVHVDLDEAKVLIRMFILACGARYLSPFNEYSEWAVVEEEKHVNCDIPIIPVVVYDFLRRDVIGYHNPAFKWFEIGDNISHSIPFGTFFEAEFKIEKTETSPSASLLVPDPAYRYPHDLYLHCRGRTQQRIQLRNRQSHQLPLQGCINSPQKNLYHQVDCNSCSCYWLAAHRNDRHNYDHCIEQLDT
ncbi:hypothetical protein FRC20_003154 [Serendipita sp. 405]|nr:hypothetical protein FRC15_010143 [Serendipita sp. 397]KAG8845569.1 hypothetical protein FRC20_003154 [Serendipita sp. 405]